jgi:hypothetical protein
MNTRFAFAALLSLILFVPPAAAEPPSSFISMIFAPYKSMGDWGKDVDACRDYCATDLAKLLKSARAKKLIDYDPVCQCQKGGDAYMMFSGSTGATTDDYLVTMKKVGKPGTWVLKLKWIGSDWKINDIVENRGGKQVSLRQRLASAGS